MQSNFFLNATVVTQLLKKRGQKNVLQEDFGIFRPLVSLYIQSISVRRAV